MYGLLLYIRPFSITCVVTSPEHIIAVAKNIRLFSYDALRLACAGLIEDCSEILRCVLETTKVRRSSSKAEVSNVAHE
jgi:hypothetical protein